MSGEGIGARLPRKEDDRFLRGRGQYVGDIRPPGLQEVAFLRSPLAHARIKAVQVPLAMRDRVFTTEAPDRRCPNPSRHHTAWLQVLRAAGAGHGQGALRR